MEAILYAQSKSLLFISRRSHTHTHVAAKRSHHISAILSTRPSYSTVTGVTDAGNLKRKEKVTTIEPVKKKESYDDDNWLEKMAIDYLSRSLQAAIGLSSSKTGYDGLVDAAKMVARNFELKQQHELILHALERAFPSTILSVIRKLLPHSKLTRELFAVFTTIFFAWLVGPSEVRETEHNGRREKSVVYIPKCRFLEQTNCVGMCNHLCKIPSQTFIKNSLGMPVYMNPNFDDISCEIIFGQNPPELTDDPALKQPCYKFCKSNQQHVRNTKGDT